MSLWNIIRDWFVQYIWGGTLSNGDLMNENTICVLDTYYSDGTSDDFYQLYTTDIFLKFDNVSNDIHGFMSMGDWLSTTSTIICLTLLVVACIYFLVWLFRFVSGLYLLRS